MLVCQQIANKIKTDLWAIWKFISNRLIVRIWKHLGRKSRRRGACSKRVWKYILTIWCNGGLPNWFVSQVQLHPCVFWSLPLAIGFMFLFTIIATCHGNKLKGQLLIIWFPTGLDWSLLPLHPLMQRSGNVLYSWLITYSQKEDHYTRKPWDWRLSKYYNIALCEPLDKNKHFNPCSEGIADEKILRFITLSQFISTSRETFTYSWPVKLRHAFQPFPHSRVGLPPWPIGMCGRKWAVLLDLISWPAPM